MLRSNCFIQCHGHLRMSDLWLIRSNGRLPPTTTTVEGMSVRLVAPCGAATACARSAARQSFLTDHEDLKMG